LRGPGKPSPGRMSVKKDPKHNKRGRGIEILKTVGGKETPKTSCIMVGREKTMKKREKLQFGKAEWTDQN